tara:strand:+ start:164288 stop:165355 length:1068 start_codon:yes stop_codon:yes gene_type:complete
MNLFRLLILIALLLGVVSPTMADEVAVGSSSTITKVTLRSTVRLASDVDGLTLGHIAKIEGPQHDVIAAIAIETKVEIEQGRWSSIELADIRAKIAEARGINEGSVVLAGSDVSITRRRDASQASTAPKLIKNTSVIDSGPVLREHLEAWIYGRLGTKPETTRIKFDERDTELLAKATSDRVIEIREIGRAKEIRLRVTMYEQDRIIEDSTMQIDVQVQRRVRVTTAQQDRRSLLSQEHSTVETRWMYPTLAIADPDDSIGLECKTTIKPGTMVMSSMLTQPILVKRGQLVSARSVVGGFVVTKIVRAMGTGELGDVIELESKDRKSKFAARIAGKGRVVIVQDTPGAKKENEGT